MKGVFNLLSYFFLEFMATYRRSHWFHTIMMSRTELDKAFNNLAMRKRCGKSRDSLLITTLLKYYETGHIDLLSLQCRSRIC